MSDTVVCIGGELDHQVIQMPRRPYFEHPVITPVPFADLSFADLSDEPTRGIACEIETCRIEQFQGTGGFRVSVAVESSLSVNDVVKVLVANYADTAQPRRMT